MLHVNINKSNVILIMLHVDIIYLACRGQKYATIKKDRHVTNSQGEHGDIFLFHLILLSFIFINTITK